MVSSSCVKVVLVLVAFLCLLGTSLADFTWEDCGVQLSKDIHYVSASISPDPVGTSGPLSINVKASLSSKIYNADSRLVVFKDGQLYLDVYIQDLCTIISTTNSLSCPLPVGDVSFTYTFQSLPTLPIGYYDFQLRSYVDSQEEGCIQLSGSVGKQLLTASSPNFQTSSFKTVLAGGLNYQTSTPTQRNIGDYVVGMGNFQGAFQGTADLGGSVDLSAYRWSIIGSLNSMNQTGSQLFHYYSGTWSVDSVAETLLDGYFNWTYTYNPNSSPSESIVGTFTPNPAYTFSPNFTYPIVVGNLSPFQVMRQSDGTLLVSGSRQWCSVTTDACGVCGGDGSSCKLVIAAPATGWSSYKYAVVIVGTVGGVLALTAITILAILIRRERRISVYDDSDLLDHPQKPDYGTMAIDDIIREGERATY